MSIFADAHREWEQARDVANTTGTAVARAEAENLRQQLGQHPAVSKARQAVKGRLGKVTR